MTAKCSINHSTRSKNMLAFFRREKVFLGFEDKMELLYKLLKTCCSILLISWIIGFIWFAESISRPPEDLKTHTDAIVVLTGGSNRVEVGFDLLQNNIAKKLFITGVGKRVSIEALQRKYNIIHDSSSSIELGYQARNTKGNAKETTQWMQKHGYKSIRLVTANYHMPRSLLEFKFYMPDIIIIPHPVDSDRVRSDDWWYWPGTVSLMIREYCKFIYVFVKEAI